MITKSWALWKEQSRVSLHDAVGRDSVKMALIVGFNTLVFF